uniref:Zinc finger BED domain-containing protein DAYSLEEPER-like n=1 Tax=Tanacetum cinerariifolium TaxID=118510 RepID=A0A6L2MC45_TANCI|nr:zinc finger BED domain-containing protein DAYSLEEPER-like [Tanacetum cinerariifolium]
MDTSFIESNAIFDIEMKPEYFDTLLNNNVEIRPTKRGKKNSMVWEDFTTKDVGDGETRAVCMICKKDLAYIKGSINSGTSHLKRHLEHHKSPSKISVQAAGPIKDTPRRCKKYTPQRGSKTASVPVAFDSESPSGEDWNLVDNLCAYLKLIFDTASMIASSSVPRANTFFVEAWKIQLELTRASTRCANHTSRNKKEHEEPLKLVSDVGKLWNVYYMLELSMVRCLSLVVSRLEQGTKGDIFSFGVQGKIVVLCTFPTEGMRSIISMGSIGLDGLLPSILLLVEIIVAVILVVVVIDAIVKVVIVVVIIGVEVVVTIIRVVVVVGVSFIIKLSLMIIGCQFLESSHICLEINPFRSQFVKFVFKLLDLSPETVLLYQKLLEFNPGACLGFLFVLPIFSMLAACASRAAATRSTIRTGLLPSGHDTIHNELSNSTKIDSSKRYSGVVDLTGDKDPSDEDGGFNIGDSDNTGDGGKIAGREITSWGGGMVSYAYMTSIFKSSCKGEKTSMSKRYLVKLFEESREMFLSKAEKQFRMFVEEKIFSKLESDGTIVERGDEYMTVTTQ